MGIGALCSMEHRGATGAEVETGDGAGVLIQIPHRFLSEVVGFVLPAEGSYGVGVAFLPANKKLRDAAVVAVERIITNKTSMYWVGVRCRLIQVVLARARET